MVESVTETEIRCDISQFHVVTDFHSQKFTVSAERVGGSTPGVRVTWSTTAPPECVASVTVEFRNGSSGSVMRPYTTTNTSGTVVIQTGLHCPTTYYIRVAVAGVPSLGTVDSSEVQKLVGGKIIVCIACPYRDQVFVFAWVLGDVWYVSINAMGTMLHEWDSAMEFRDSG